MVAAAVAVEDMEVVDAAMAVVAAATAVAAAVDMAAVVAAVNNNLDPSRSETLKTPCFLRRPGLLNPDRFVFCFVKIF